MSANINNSNINWKKPFPKTAIQRSNLPYWSDGSGPTTNTTPMSDAATSNFSGNTTPRPRWAPLAGSPEALPTANPRVTHQWDQPRELGTLGQSTADGSVDGQRTSVGRKRRVDGTATVSPKTSVQPSTLSTVSPKTLLASSSTTVNNAPSSSNDLQSPPNSSTPTATSSFSTSRWATRIGSTTFVNRASEPNGRCTFSDQELEAILNRQKVLSSDQYNYTSHPDFKPLRYTCPLCGAMFRSKEASTEHWVESLFSFFCVLFWLILTDFDWGIAF